MKTVIEMAREAGLITNSFGDVHGDIYHLERFAALVREDEREACAKVCDVASKVKHDEVRIQKLIETAFNYCAEAIRARGEK